ncbi:MAG: DUF2752 domain-containing protein [Flavobacteriaceae bacterium]|nr:DUF2752 domain-containing protein [Flavobacteriaceae bacterium]
MNVEKYFLPCINKSLFGVDCFGCGTQRSLLYLSNGEFTKAFYQFPAIYTTILLFILIGLHVINKKSDYQKIIIGLAIINTLIMIISYIYKITNIK